MQRPQDARYYLSIIIPAFNEEKRLPDTLTHITEFIEKQDYSTEVLVVDNASSDRTGDIISDFTRRYPFFKRIFEPVKGKGAAVRTGVMASRGEFLLFCDADMAIPIEEVNKFLPPHLNDYDIGIGAREAFGAHRFNESLFRRFIGRAFNLMVQSLLLPGFKDTQCGFKCFRRDIAHDLFSSITINGWCFDVEIIYIALLKGYRIIEVPVDVFYRNQSGINLIRDPWHMLGDILKIKKNGRRGLYTIKGGLNYGQKRQ